MEEPHSAGPRRPTQTRLRYARHRRLRIHLDPVAGSIVLADAAAVAVLDPTLRFRERRAAAFRGAQLLRQVIPTRIAVELVSVPTIADPAAHC